MAETAALMLGSRVSAMALGLVQLVLMTHTFGASYHTDAFFVAQSVAFLLVSAVESSMNMAFTPVFIHTREAEGEEVAWRLASGLYRVGLIVVVAFGLIVLMLAPLLAGLFGAGLPPEFQTLTGNLIRLLLIAIPFMYTAAFLASLEFIGGRYWTPALAMVLQAGLGPLALWLLAPRFGIAALVFGLLGGAVVRCALQALAFPAKRRLFRGALAWNDPRMRPLGRMVGVRLVASWFMELDLAVARYFAAQLGPGAVSALAYASRAVMTLVRVLIMPLGRVMVPALSQLAAQKNFERMRFLAERLVMLLGVILIPAVAYVIGFRHDLLDLVLGHGQFQREALEATAVAVFYLGLGVVPFILNPLLNGLFYAMKDSRTPLRVGFLCSCANVVLNLMLMRVLGLGGVALATSLVALVRAVLLWRFLIPQVGRLKSGQVLRSLLLSALAAVGGLAAATAAASWYGARVGEPHMLVRLAVAGAVLVVGYSLLQVALNRRSLGPLVQFVRRRRG